MATAGVESMDSFPPEDYPVGPIQGHGEPTQQLQISLGSMHTLTEGCAANNTIAAPFGGGSAVDYRSLRSGFPLPLEHESVPVHIVYQTPDFYDIECQALELSEEPSQEFLLQSIFDLCLSVIPGPMSRFLDRALTPSMGGVRVTVGSDITDSPELREELAVFRTREELTFYRAGNDLQLSQYLCDKRPLPAIFLTTSIDAPPTGHQLFFFESVIPPYDLPKAQDKPSPTLTSPIPGPSHGPSLPPLSLEKSTTATRIQPVPSLRQTLEGHRSVAFVPTGTDLEAREYLDKSFGWLSAFIKARNEHLEAVQASGRTHQYSGFEGIASVRALGIILRVLKLPLPTQGAALVRQSHQYATEDGQMKKLLPSQVFRIFDLETRDTFSRRQTLLRTATQAFKFLSHIPYSSLDEADELMLHELRRLLREDPTVWPVPEELSDIVDDALRPLTDRYAAVAKRGNLSG
jgi:hypothetical protein